MCGKIVYFDGQGVEKFIGNFYPHFVNINYTDYTL